MTNNLDVMCFSDRSSPLQTISSSSAMEERERKSQQPSQDVTCIYDSNEHDRGRPRDDPTRLFDRIMSNQRMFDLMKDQMDDQQTSNRPTTKHHMDLHSPSEYYDSGSSYRRRDTPTEYLTPAGKSDAGRDLTAYYTKDSTPHRDYYRDHSSAYGSGSYARRDTPSEYFTPASRPDDGRDDPAYTKDNTRQSRCYHDRSQSSADEHYLHWTSSRAGDASRDEWRDRHLEYTSGTGHSWRSAASSSGPRSSYQQVDSSMARDATSAGDFLSHTEVYSQRSSNARWSDDWTDSASADTNFANGNNYRQYY